MINNEDQLKIVQERIQEYRNRLETMENSKDALLRNPTIQHAYKQGIEKIICDLENEIKVYEAKICRQ